MRELALRGARELRPDETVRAISELKLAGVSWPEESLAGALTVEEPLGEHDPGDPHPGTRALAEVRGDRV
ncbi:MAG: hypothetical protein FVQ78_06850 [Solirubrobacterales bacterium]|nr:hypothetical protein [Solirubrobacterales bacterium]